MIRRLQPRTFVLQTEPAGGDFVNTLLARFPLERNRSSDKESRKVKKLEPVMTGKPLRTFP
ncbi:hypothetical protein B1812_13015 [Methylocystis bryophila]|uniref:Uncharacterized protein n=1 Tax=Methylocystis bryophila TaxID=655015 RepID=A0A1W6MW70_9HYPH|nr:hypothetical protein B1812_13015 [Methylocystis bryophila]